jgi:hypothetical protein
MDAAGRVSSRRAAAHRLGVVAGTEAVSRTEKVLAAVGIALIVGLWTAVFVFADWPWI